MAKYGHESLTLRQHETKKAPDLKRLFFEKVGGADRDRTDDIMTARRSHEVFLTYYFY